VEFGLRTGSGTLLQADGLAMAKAGRSYYVLSRRRGSCSSLAQQSGDVSGWAVRVFSCVRYLLF